ncbi:Putative glycosyltransferase EpsE [Aquisphaera giovannonii]|uniref:Glycosyltransferase EpsE n=1 Tax=Aquisphaera giovannonii TaxID=406548 RepID=A0A5B9W7R4_9BACT|nr:glycosyltransferase family 2 protein [Aquisphaera giovannonii]QEH36387.1 Putative glycosyltransferase EpsE [Aquisphaera giovannonii]
MDLTPSAAAPLVSVVTIFLDAGAFLEEAIRSVFGQTYTHWELLLVDDGSTDRSSAIARDYAGREPGKVRYLEHPGHVNRGMSASRNLGIRCARGGLIALLDADDVWLPRKLEEQVAILASRPEVGMVIGRSRYWFGWTGRAEDAGRDAAPEYDVAAGSIVDPPGLLRINYPLGGGTAPCPSDILFRADLVARHGAFEEAFVGDLQLYEDQAFLAKVYLKEKVYVSGETWDLYRQHRGSCVSQVKRAGRYHAVRARYLRWLAEYLEREGCRDPDVLRAMKRALRPYDHPYLDAIRRAGRPFYKALRRSCGKVSRALSRARGATSEVSSPSSPRGRPPRDGRPAG